MGEPFNFAWTHGLKIGQQAQVLKEGKEEHYQRYTGGKDILGRGTATAKKQKEALENRVPGRGLGKTEKEPGPDLEGPVFQC